MALRPIRRNPKTGLLPNGLKRRPSKKTWRKGHRLKTGKWVPGIWVFRAGKAARVKPSAKPKPKKPRKVPRPPAPIRAKPHAKPKAKPKVRAKAQPQVPLKKAGPLTKEQVRRKRELRRRSKARTEARDRKLLALAGPSTIVIAVRRKPWPAERKRRARLVASRTGSSVVAADALIRRATAKGVAYDRVTWENLQGRDLTFAGRVRRLDKMVGRTSTPRQEAMDLAAKRADFREKQEMKRRERRRKAVDRPGVEHHAMAKIEDDLRRRAEQLERALFGL